MGEADRGDFASDADVRRTLKSGCVVCVEWLRIALANLDAEAEYISRDDPGAASRILTTLQRAVGNLRNVPAMGRAGRVMGTRELVVPGTLYIVRYRVRKQTVEILRLFHAARRWPKNF